MKNQHLAVLLLAPLFTRTAVAQAVDWAVILKIPPRTLIYVLTPQKETLCTLQKVTDEQLFCHFAPISAHQPKPPNGDLVFNRAEIRGVDTGDRLKGDLEDDSQGSLALLGAFEAGGGWDSARQPTSFGGLKIGILGTAMDLQYDGLAGQNGFSVEGSAVLPLFRVPAYYPLRDKKFLKVYVEPGMGYRAGDGLTGEYGSAKALFILLDDRWLDKPSPYVEVQHRFPLSSPLGGDTRIAFGIMWAYCWHCGVE